jgi:hypothetical protein
LDAWVCACAAEQAVLDLLVGQQQDTVEHEMCLFETLDAGLAMVFTQIHQNRAKATLAGNAVAKL